MEKKQALRHELDLRGLYSKNIGRSQAAKDKSIRKRVHGYVTHNVNKVNAVQVPYHVGFTGSRDVQQDRPGDLRCILDVLLGHGFLSLHHGNCIGGDFLAHEAALRCGYSIVVHPPVSERFAFVHLDDPLHRVDTLEPKLYLDRNHDIVNSSILLIALPKHTEHLRSGTWATVRYARRRGKPIIIV